MDRDQHWVRLGRLLVERRVGLGYKKRTAFAEAKGFPNTRVIAAIENAERQNFDQSTLVSFEIAYGWQLGSIAAVLKGGQPVVVPEQPLRPPESAFETIDEPSDDLPYPWQDAEPTGEWAQMHGRSATRDYLKGTSVQLDGAGRPTRLELRFWPASDDQYVEMVGFLEAVAQAHRAALKAMERKPRQSATDEGLLLNDSSPERVDGLKPLEFRQPPTHSLMPDIPEGLAADDPGEPTEYQRRADADHGDDNEGR